MPLVARADWYDHELPYSAGETDRYEARVARVRGEVGEMRAAAGGPFLEEVAAFCDRAALELEHANDAPGGVELDAETDTRQRDGYVPTVAGRALLIARAWTSTHFADAGRG